MNLAEIASKLITDAFGENKKVKEFRDDFLNAFVDWIRPLFLKDDPKLVSALETDASSQKTQGRLEARIEDLLGDEKFKKELIDWVEKSARISAEEKNILVSDDLEGSNLIIGDKSTDGSTVKRKNIASIKKGKFSGDVRIGDG